MESEVLAYTFCHSAHIPPTASRRLVFTAAATSTFISSVCGSQFYSSGSHEQILQRIFYLNKVSSIQDK
uniref:Uncharacterized protein n=1 Tax=Solanum lycopersicum TaxID=4081 RepID=A0A3Q7GEU2_SOLLC